MIVVDSNIIAYCWLNGPLTARAQRVRVKDPDWQIPVLWRSELRSILAGYLREGSLSAAQVRLVMQEIEGALEGHEHLIESAAVFAVVARTRLSTYDCEFVALAQGLSAQLVTEDRAVLKACPDTATSIDAFLA